MFFIAKVIYNIIKMHDSVKNLPNNLWLSRGLSPNVYPFLCIGKKKQNVYYKY